MLDIDAENKEAKRELAALARKQKEQNAKDAALFKKAFAKPGLYKDFKAEAKPKSGWDEPEADEEPAAAAEPMDVAAAAPPAAEPMDAAPEPVAAA